MAERYRIIGKRIPSFISRNIGNGHRDRNMYFCYKCGSQKIDFVDDSGNHEWRCLVCNPIQDETTTDLDSIEGVPSDVEDNTSLDFEPWA